jgi:hypothetical protein
MMNDVAAARDRLRRAEREWAEVQERHAVELAQAAAQAHQAQAAADEMHRATLAESAAAWARHALELTEQAKAAGTETEQVTGVVLRGDGSSEPYVQMVFARDVLAGRAAEASVKAERLRAFAAPGGLDSSTLARVVDEQSELPVSGWMTVSGSAPLQTSNAAALRHPLRE